MKEIEPTFVDQISQRHVERRGEPGKIFYPGIDLAALNMANIVPMQAGQLGQHFLAPATFDPQ